MMTPQYDYLAFDDTRELYWKAWKEVLDDARAHGMTTVDPMVSMPLKEVKDGKGVADFAAMDRFMDLAKSAGFKQPLFGYCIGTGFSMRPPLVPKDPRGPEGDALDPDKKQGGAERFGLKTYGEMARYEKMLSAVDCWCAGLHSPKLAELVLLD